MSRVTGVMLICSIGDAEDQMPAINAWLADHGADGRWYLKDTSDHAGGSKHPQFETWCGGLNFFEGQEDAFAEFVMSLDWCSDENLVLIVENEEQATKVYRPKQWANVVGVERPKPEPTPPKLGPPDFTRWA